MDFDSLLNDPSFDKKVKNQQIDIGMKNPEGLTILEYTSKHPKYIKQLESLFLLRTFNTFYEENSVGRQALNLAVKERNIQAVKLYLKSNVYQNISGPQDTYLDTAIRLNRFDIIKLLVEFGEDVNKMTISKKSSLMEACWYGNLEIVEYLIKQGADVNYHSSNGTPLVYAVAKNDLEIIETLLKNAANIHLSNEDNDSILFGAITNGSYDIIRYLVDNGASINMTNRLGETPLMKAVEWGDYETTKYFVENGANIHAQNNLGESVLYYAILGGNTEIVRMLVHGGISYQSTLKKIKIFSYFPTLEMLDYVLGLGASINACKRTSLGTTYEALNFYNKTLEYLEILNKYKDKMCPELLEQFEEKRLQMLIQATLD